MAATITGGDKVFERVWPGNTTPVAVDGAGNVANTLGGWVLFNAAASTRFVRFFNKGVAPTMGTDTARLVVPLPAGALANVGLVRPVLFDLGLWVSVTTAMADADNTAPVANDVLMTLFYQ